jgi:hypothetical protein
MVPICLIGRGYDFKDAQGHLSDLEARLDPAKLFELREALGGLASDARDPKSVQSALFATLPRIIAVNWEPETKRQAPARRPRGGQPTCCGASRPGAGETPALTQSRRPCSRWLPLCAWPTHD